MHSTTQRSTSQDIRVKKQAPTHHIFCQALSLRLIVLPPNPPGCAFLLIRQTSGRLCFVGFQNALVDVAARLFKDPGPDLAPDGRRNSSIRRRDSSQRSKDRRLSSLATVPMALSTEDAFAALLLRWLVPFGQAAALTFDKEVIRSQDAPLKNPEVRHQRGSSATHQILLAPLALLL